MASRPTRSTSKRGTRQTQQLLLPPGPAPLTGPKPEYALSAFSAVLFPSSPILGASGCLLSLSFSPRIAPPFGPNFTTLLVHRLATSSVARPGGAAAPSG